MDWYQEGATVELVQNAFLVSILVVMDWYQEGWCWIGCDGQRICFNPCCDGLVSGSIDYCKELAATIVVSILVVMDWYQEAFLTYHFCGRLPCFNPCCDGLVSGSPHESRQTGCRTVSILVVMDWYQEVWDAGVLKVGNNLVSILVVMDWYQEEDPPAAVGQ